MIPPPGERLLQFVGDKIQFALTGPGGTPLPSGWRPLLRTNIGRGALLNAEIIADSPHYPSLRGAGWRDVPFHLDNGTGRIAFTLTEPGFFSAKAYLVDPEGRQHWTEGPNLTLSVHPDRLRTANTIYCAFVRMFGETRSAQSTLDDPLEPQLKKLDKLGYAVISPSGKLRDLKAQLPHIFDTLGCRFLHLLPVNPTPTVYARFGRFGSPYASLDLTAIDPALVELDRRTTGVDQFRELTGAVHAKGGRVILDLVVNHTGWGSNLQENHPDWFLRHPDGTFVSPGAWGTTWEDLVELDHRQDTPWNYLAEIFLTWCRRGVDGFRCDAGYKVPTPAWQYITARVRYEFPETVFLLEGLGGSWEATETLLTEGGMQWAYSELFQNYSGSQISWYLDYSLRQSQRVGLYIHYSETHDNDRLAKNGRAWSLLRNRLCALTSASGGFGFTCGVEWLAAEKINVHSCRALAWGNPDNVVQELGRLNRLLAEHPCFFDGARLTRISTPASPVFALRRVSAEGADQLLVLVNTDTATAHGLVLQRSLWAELGMPQIDLLGQTPPAIQLSANETVSIRMPPAAAYCLSSTPEPRGLGGQAYRLYRARIAWAVAALHTRLPPEEISKIPDAPLAAWVDRNPASFLAALDQLPEFPDVLRWLEAFAERLNPHYPRVITWAWNDHRRITCIPPNHWLCIVDRCPFRVHLEGIAAARHAESISFQLGHVASFPPIDTPGQARLRLERCAADHPHVHAQLRFLSSSPGLDLTFERRRHADALPANAVVLLTNARGGMSRLGADLGAIQSKYDCLLAANLHLHVPVDRQILAKRARVWINADGFISPLNAENLIAFDPKPPARWRFLAGAGDGRAVEISLEIDMLDGQNCVILRFERAASPLAVARDLPPDCDVRLTVRIDVEDRNYHTQTRRTPDADHFFSTRCQPLKDAIGFRFDPAPDRFLRVWATSGRYHHESEWSLNISHPVEASRGQVASGDAYSPGWFDLPLAKGGCLCLILSAEPDPPKAEQIAAFAEERRRSQFLQLQWANLPENDPLGRQLALAVHPFVVRRRPAKTIIAGYPWFLDWGRDSLICARGLVAAGLAYEVQQLLLTFARLEQHGTLPNSIHGEDASNRDTSDAPLWFGIACHEAATLLGNQIYSQIVDGRNRTLSQVLASIAQHYSTGTPNGIRMDPSSALIWSPKHFTWMDTNYPAGTPRMGYPIEIQALWIRLLRQLARLNIPSRGEPWLQLADRALDSVERLFWLPDKGYYADVLIASPGQPAQGALQDDALRSNALFLLSLGLVRGDRARASITAAARHLVVPGGLRSLAPLPVAVPLPVHAPDGRLLNDPMHPYWGRYEGDEDTRRKPAYHNGTAWTWTFPNFCEALARAWDLERAAVDAARAYLSSIDHLLNQGCLGHLPELVDGDAPHHQRGCDAQAWAATECLRVWKWLNSI